MKNSKKTDKYEKVLKKSVDLNPLGNTEDFRGGKWKSIYFKPQNATF